MARKPDFSSPRWRADQEKVRKLRDSPRLRAEAERTRLIAEKLRKAKTPPPKPKRKLVGRKPSLTPAQIAKGVGLLRDKPKMTIEAARATLRNAGISGSDSALYRLVIKPAYDSR